MLARKQVKRMLTVASKHIYLADEQLNVIHEHALHDNMLFDAHKEADRINYLFDRHAQAIIEDEQRLIARFTHKERNAHKRSNNTLKRLSTFCKSSKVESQAFRIDECLTQFHTMKELLSALSDCREARVKSHISFLQNNFAHTCKLVYSEDKKRFKFVLI